MINVMIINEIFNIPFNHMKFWNPVCILYLEHISIWMLNFQQKYFICISIS